MNRLTGKIFLIILWVMALALPATAIELQSEVTDEPISPTPTISLITCWPGSDIYELYGHTMLRVVTPEGEDMVYNYGIFDFSAPNFVYRFVKGETDYMVRAYPTVVALYGYQGRKTVEQTLNLTPEQAQSIKTALEINELPENRVYRYNYLLDNCATRPRDIVENALGGSLRYGQMNDTLTYRQQMRYRCANYPWQQFGIDLALGSGLDRILTYREQMFVPMTLMEAFEGATVERDGITEPLVVSSCTLIDGNDNGDILPPTPWYASPMAAAIALLVIVILFTRHDLRRRHVSRWLDFLLYIIYGLAGCLVAYLILISTHEATSPNFNALWLNPFYLVVAVLTLIPSARKAAILCHFIVAVVTLLTLLFWWALPQTANPAFFPLMAVPAIRSISYFYITICGK